MKKLPLSNDDREDDPKRARVEVAYVKLVRETALARLYQLNDDPWEPDRIWLPKSQIVDDDMDTRGRRFVLIPQWLAEEKNLSWR